MVDEFAAVVDRCRKKKSSQVIENEAIEHASILFKNLIKIATDEKEEIRIVSGNLREDFYSDFIPNVRTYLSGEAAKIELIVLNTAIDLDLHSFASILEKSQKCKVWQVDPEEFKSPHFILVGDRRYRLETDHDRTKAVACFENELVGGFLKVLFDRLRRCIEEKENLSLA